MITIKALDGKNKTYHLKEGLKEMGFRWGNPGGAVGKCWHISLSLEEAKEMYIKIEKIGLLPSWSYNDKREGREFYFWEKEYLSN